MKGRGVAHLALLIANLIYGVNYTMAKIALPKYIKPFGFIFVRVAIAGSLFWLFHLTIREKVKTKDLLRLAICGLFGVAINQLLFFQGLSMTTEINASLLMITTPILVLTLGHFLIGERITWLKMLGIFLGAGGAFLLIGFGKDFSFGASTSWGDILVLINATSYALYLVLVKPLMSKYHPLTVIKWVFLFGFIIVAIAGWRQFEQIEWSTFDWKVWSSVVYVVFGTTFLAYLLNIFALSRVQPSTVSVYIYSQPLVATLVSVSVGNDVLTPLRYWRAFSSLPVCIWLHVRGGKNFQSPNFATLIIGYASFHDGLRPCGERERSSHRHC